MDLHIAHLFLVYEGKPHRPSRCVIDYKGLNAVTRKDVYPIENLESILLGMKGVEVMTAIDLKAGFHQIPVDERDRHKTAFSTTWGQWQYKRMPFGLCNPPSVFQRKIANILEPMIKEGIVKVYIDDILLKTKRSEHLHQLERLLNLLAESNAIISPTKVKFMCEKVEYLGCEVSKIGIGKIAKNFDAIKRMTRPNNKKQAQAVLGLASYFRDFHPFFTDKTIHILKATKHATEDSTQWTEECDKEFEDLKDTLMTQYYRSYPDYSEL